MTIHVSEFWLGILTGLGATVGLMLAGSFLSYLYFVLVMSGTLDRLGAKISGRDRRFRKYIAQQESERTPRE